MKGQLTEKQRLFADMVLKGATLSHSYVSVYAGGDGSRKATKGQANQASKVWRSPPIQAYADAARAHVENNRARRALGTRERIERQLWVEADGEKSADRLRALELLGKSIGTYRPVRYHPVRYRTVIYRTVTYRPVSYRPVGKLTIRTRRLSAWNNPQAPPPPPITRARAAISLHTIPLKRSAHIQHMPPRGPTERSLS